MFYKPASIRVAWTLSASMCATAFASAQTQQVCFDDAIPLTPTNWTNESLTVPKFDAALGILTSIEFTLEGLAEGSAAIESLDMTPTTVQTSFEATLTLQRPDLTTIVVTVPGADFTDNLTAFDGIIDFGGTSGITHAGITAMGAAMSTSPPPPSDIALFTGPAGNPGTITLPVTGEGSSTASGSGNLLTQFMTSASCELTICYSYSLDCNMNGIPDEDDLDDGTSEDCNANDVPDECELNPGLSYCFGVGCPCGNPDPAAGCANSTGAGGLLSASGSASISADDLILTGTNLLPGEMSMLYSADVALANCAGRTFGDGLRCTGMNALRLVTQNPDVNGDVSFGPGLIALEASPVPGDERRYQIWYRDVAGPCGTTFNLTNGYAITFAP